MKSFELTFITPLFSRGAYEDRPEIRPPSIRGQLHWWLRALGGNAVLEKELFGGVGQQASSSKLVVRISGIEGTTGRPATLPHKPPGRNNDEGPNAPRAAFLPGTRCRLDFLWRGNHGARLLGKFEQCMEAWLLLGTLGLRATRAGGSFQWHLLSGSGLQYPATFQEYEARCRKLLQGAPLKFDLLDRSYNNPEEARGHITDTLGGRDDRGCQDDLGRLNQPLGFIGRGERKTSPLRFRLVGCEGSFRIAALWDARDIVTGNKTAVDLPGVIRLLAERKPNIGSQLAESNLGKP
jgi:hypothetical protein